MLKDEVQMSQSETAGIDAINQHAVALTGSSSDYDGLVAAARGKSLVLLGESTHGSAEFYRARAEISRRLIEEEGFAAVVVEADWPDAFAVNRHVWGMGQPTSAEAALASFERFPQWLWRNRETLEFVEWLAAYNAPEKLDERESRPTGFYGLDLYSMSASAQAVVSYLERYDPPAAQRARQRYGCLDHFFAGSGYGLNQDLGLSQACEQDLSEQLLDLQNRAWKRLVGLGLAADEQRFAAEQNARLVSNAERYYRAMFRAGPDSWNQRDQHMFETLEALREHLGHQLGDEARLIVWAHNSHVGNAAATDMAGSGQTNLGELVRRQYGERALLVGLQTAEGDVIAADDWDEPARSMVVRPPLDGSYEAIFQGCSAEDLLLDLRPKNAATEFLADPRLQRAIGVVYRPESERQSHYLRASLPAQFDFVVHFDRTTGVTPLAPLTAATQRDLDETYPSGL